MFRGWTTSAAERVDVQTLEFGSCSISVEESAVRFRGAMTPPTTRCISPSSATSCCNERTLTQALTDPQLDVRKGSVLALTR